MPLKTFTGTSSKGSIQEALDLALQAAIQAETGADQMTEWTLTGVSGRRGGLAGVNEVIVEIKASVS